MSMIHKKEKSVGRRIFSESKNLEFLNYFQNLVLKLLFVKISEK